MARSSDAKRAVVLALRIFAVAALSAACASVLGIETTKRTNRAGANYNTGYAGCKANSCADCLSQAHRTACEGEAGYGAGYDGCKDGDCNGCQAAHRDECNGEAGYGTGANAGYEGCVAGDCDQCVSDAHRCLCQNLPVGCILLGGADGGGGVDAQFCEQTNLDGCAECVCDSCDLASCLTDAMCNEVFSCMVQYQCNPAVAASDTCYTDQLCKGVIDSAGGLEGPAYSALLNLVQCSSTETCDCPFGAQGTSTGGCEAGTECDGGGGSTSGECVAPDNCDTCSSVGKYCRCNGGSAEECLPEALGADCETFFADDACNGCACNSCQEELFDCSDSPGCMDLAHCLHVTDCSGTDCDTSDTCRGIVQANGGVQGINFGFASALVQCEQQSTCPCERTQGNPDTITCGSRQCAAHVTEGDAGSDVLSACCFELNSTQYCGLDVSDVLYDATCEPKGQSGTANNQCPGFRTPDVFPYFGTLLAGCCRPQGAGCGYSDSVTGLGCVPPRVFDGFTTSPKACN
jgi:hypothetical protein